MKVSRHHDVLLDSFRWIGVVLTLLIVALLLQRGEPILRTLEINVDRLVAGRTFNFVSWEIDAMGSKIAFRLLSPHRWMDDEQQAYFVLDYLADVREAQRLAYEIDRIYVDLEIDDPDRASLEEQAAFAALRERMEASAPIAEAILEDQVSDVLYHRGGFGALGLILPWVRGTFTPLPHMLIISPRDQIDTAYQQQLVAGLTASEQNDIEERVMDVEDDHSAYVTAIGGLAAYPSMLLESSSIEWVTDVIAHEWVHHYLSFGPLGWDYMRSGETRTINETTASLLGDWAGHEVVLRYYAPYLDRDKRLPNTLRVEESDAGSQPGFDYRAEMHQTRVTVDQLLADGKIEEAERYMEARRRVFVEHGYRLRRLNQAYFAFHGAYASVPGASGEDPIGPLVREFWALSVTPANFARDLVPITTLAELRTLLTSVDPDANHQAFP
jgi:hypothetical protein